MTQKMNLNAVRGRDDWYLGLIVRGKDQWTVPVYRHSDRARFEFTMNPPLSMADVHAEAVRQIEEWENWIGKRCTICGGRVSRSVILSTHKEEVLTHLDALDWQDNPHDVVVK